MSFSVSERTPAAVKVALPVAILRLSSFSRCAVAAVIVALSVPVAGSPATSLSLRPLERSVRSDWPALMLTNASGLVVSRTVVGVPRAVGTAAGASSEVIVTVAGVAASTAPSPALDSASVNVSAASAAASSSSAASTTFTLSPSPKRSRPLVAV